MNLKSEGNTRWHRIWIVILAGMFSVGAVMAERVSFKVEGRGSRYGQLHMKDGQLSVTLDNGEREAIAWENFRELNFFPKHDSIRSEEPDRDRALSKTWRHADVGPMVAKGSAHGDESGMDLFTSRRVSEEGFRAFSMAYQEGPENGHITARVLRIGHKDHLSRAGVIIRDGTETGAGNFMLVVHPGTGASFHGWRIANGYSSGDFHRTIRPPYWVRLVRKDGVISSFISPDGKVWTKIRDLSESTILGSARKKGSAPSNFGVVATAASGDVPWAASFDNISIGPLSEIEPEAGVTNPRIHLIDGSIVRAQVTTNEKGTLFKIGAPWNRTLPALYVSRVDYFYPLDPDKKKVTFTRPGVLLRGGDLIEGEFQSFLDGKVVVNSDLVGRREYEAGARAEIVFLRDQNTARRSNFAVELLDGQVVFAKEISLEDGKFVFDCPFVGECEYGPEQLRQITHISELKN